MTNKEIEAFNKTFGIETVFYYDDKSICGYEENNAIYLNLNSKKDLKNVNMHELLHFFEETEMFNKIKERVIKRLKENNIFDELKEEYELKYFGIYSIDEIEKGIIDNEIVIDVLVGDFPYFKKEELEDLCKEILKAEIGINPNNDGKVIRLAFPELNEERRKELVKEIKKTAEESKVSIRSIRREAIDEAKKMQKDNQMTEDELKGAEDKIQKLTDSKTAEIDKILAEKEKEIMSV